MKYHLALPGCLLLLWTLTEFVSPAEDKPELIQVKQSGSGIQVICPKGAEFKKGDSSVDSQLEYMDENTSEYKCEEKGSIYVKFRTCDNCIELDVGSIIGMVVGDVVATIVIGVAVYLIASQNRITPIISQKKSSDRQHLVSNEMSSRGPNEHYERLRPKGGQKETYDVISNRK